MNVLDLFSGIGGFSLGLERAGMRTVAFCEIDPYCRRVLAKHWPDVPVFGDVRSLTAERLTADGIVVDLICGGYPCQPFSNAGDRNGAEDDRHLWPEVARLVSELRPTWVVCENVAGHITLGLDDALSQLESLGYATQTLVIPACAVGAIHRRERVWILAHADGGGDSRLQHELEKSSKTGQGWADNEAGRVSILADPISGGQPGPGWATKPGDQTPDSNWQTDQPIDALEWPTEPPVRGANDGFSRRLDRDRLRALGNAVVPQIPEIIGRAIMRAAE